MVAPFFVDNTKVAGRFWKTIGDRTKTKMGTFLLTEKSPFHDNIAEAMPSYCYPAFSALTEVTSDSGVYDLFSNNTWATAK